MVVVERQGEGDDVGLLDMRLGVVEDVVLEGIEEGGMVVLGCIPAAI